MAKGKRKSVAPENEAKTDKFRRLANQRLPKAVKAIDAIAKLATGTNYEWTSEQVEKIAAALRAAVVRVENSFEGGDAGPDVPII
jgi:hypothetical protein